MGRKAIDMTGMVFGRLTVLERVGSVHYRDGQSVPTWRCRCECGNELIVRGISLRNGSTRSCGCLKEELSKARFQKKNPRRAEA